MKIYRNDINLYYIKLHTKMSHKNYDFSLILKFYFIFKNNFLPLLSQNKYIDKRKKMSRHYEHILILLQYVKMIK